MGPKASVSEKLRLDPKPLTAVIARASAAALGPGKRVTGELPTFVCQLKKYRKRKICDKSILYSS